MVSTGFPLPTIRIAALLILAVPAGCFVGRSPPLAGFSAAQEVIAAGSPPTAATQGETVIAEQTQLSASQTAAVRPSQLAATEDLANAAKTATPQATPSADTLRARKAVVTGLSAAKTPEKIASTPAQPSKSDSGPAQTKQPPASPPLDVATLEQRLKGTKAIGVLTKLALKNQVDDLLDQFRAFHQGKPKTNLAALRQPYDMLLLKVLSLLQDGDPSLASSIVASREVIWGILADRDKFNSMA